MRFLLFTALSYLSCDISSRFIALREYVTDFCSSPEFPHTQEQQSLVSDTVFVLQVLDDVRSKYKPR